MTASPSCASEMPSTAIETHPASSSSLRAPKMPRATTSGSEPFPSGTMRSLGLRKSCSGSVTAGWVWMSPTTAVSGAVSTAAIWAARNDSRAGATSAGAPSKSTTRASGL
eukprot:Amastigsp_a174555_19.p5 type:complete len:110 gc:universal Amastigsp_a174555_19:1213-884(-)